MKRIFLVEDDKEIAKNLALLLRTEGFNVTHASSQGEAISVLDGNRFDLALVDISLPDGNGFTVCTEIKQAQNIPVIFLTASGDEASVVTGLNMGADDYIIKPFEMLELLARVEAVLRRTRKSGTDFVFYGIRIDFISRTIEKDGQETECTPREYELLETLVKNRNIALSRERLLDLVWGYDYEGDIRTVDVHIQKLRKKLGLEKCIKTVYKLGYRLEIPK